VKKLVWILPVLGVTAVSATVYLYAELMRYAQSPASASAVERLIVVPPGSAFRTIAVRLEDEGVLKRPTKFRLYARIRGYDKQIRAGEYQLSAGMSPHQILQVLMSGKIYLHKVTVPEGYTLVQIAGLLSEKGLADRDAFLSAAADPDAPGFYGIASDGLEGYLFPDTYHFPREIPPEKIIAAMVDRFRQQFRLEWKMRAEALGFSVHQIVTLASMIEKEAGIPSERAVISSVFHNRLAKGMRLESDPTVIYGIKDFDGNLTRLHLTRPSPYNTYRIRGLPPGPIANPGAAAIEAALYPAETPYLYFVARQDRTHHFSASIDEHNRAVRKYQLGK